ncbi:5'-3' exoribonuclease [Oryza brachyantha]|uniref:Polymerase/histidinol phosphatase N-terminal domain-containing protein n=1 Tax=Oryza brachyantha TaxID=4533 RepID=J3LKV5_ORYBR|nr:5'-3' exoribonuclease [Oryza brachyantha]
MGSRKKAKPGRSRKKPKSNADQALALDYVRAWVLPAASAPPTKPSAADAAGDGFLPHQASKMASGGGGSVLFELHSHSNHSDGFLSPSALVERAHRNGVKVLALTDHDTMAGIPEAMSAAQKFGMRIIPGVEISALYSPREIAGAGEHVHILAYYGMCGPSRFDDLERMLSNIRDGRYLRARNMLAKLNRLNVPIKWEHVTKIAGEGVAPGRLHIARAMVEMGHVENVRQAFNKYIGDDGPAYATGSEPFAETVVQLINCTGGISALAHPWALKNPDAVIRALKGAGLDAMEVYRSDGKVDGFSELAEKYGLLKIGGSDFHGRGGKDESDIGTVKLAITTLCSFLKMARPIWCSAMKDILLKFAEEPSAVNLGKIVKFGELIHFDGFSSMDAGMDIVNLCLSSWLSNDGMEEVELEEVRLKLAHWVCKR